MRKLFIGTSGWLYGHWQEVFYPENLLSKNYNPAATHLQYYSKHFKTVEINYSFYRLPRPSTYQNWYSQVSADFIFAVKASRFITHIKRLKNVKSAWKTFIENGLNLKEKLGPILFQFPPSFKASNENIERLEKFLELIRKDSLSRLPPTNILVGGERKSAKFAFEFRHKSWCDEKIYKLLKKYNVAWVIVDSPKYPKKEIITANFVYIRMHGSKILFASKYTEKELKNLAKKIKKWLKQKLDVYCYFNNDAYGYAVENAKTLIDMLMPKNF